MEQKLTVLADRLEASEPELAKALRAAWAMPGRTLAFRNAEHRNKT
jgi:hypothetical protein